MTIRFVPSRNPVVGVLVSEARLQRMEDEIAQLRMENHNLRDTIHRLQQDLLGFVLEAGSSQDIDSPGDFEDYPFSEN